VQSKFELFVDDADRSIGFYTALGFEVAHRKEDGYTTLRSGSTVVALCPLPRWLRLRWLGRLRRPPLGTEIVFYSDRLEVLHASLREAGYAPGPIERREWGSTDFRALDRDGYYVRVTDGRPVPGS